MKAKNNRTISISRSEEAKYRAQFRRLTSVVKLPDLLDAVICQDILEAVPYLPAQFADLVILDPPYNLTKTFGERKFRERDIAAYAEWVETWLALLPRVMKSTASLYFCADWRMGTVIAPVLEKYFVVRNRITWEREKGRGASRNWKNCAEDIWFATVSDEYVFHAEAVKLKRRVLAPYRDEQRLPKDWKSEGNGAYRMTASSNLWTDITVPFWSMPENTEHPTQKPEKLIAKLILASSSEGGVVLDPFLGSGTCAVVAKKLNRKYVGIEIEEKYCSIALKRLQMAGNDRDIQGMVDGVFWERNSLAEQNAARAKKNGDGRKRY